MHFLVLDIADVLWPSSFWLLATNGFEGTLDSWIIIGMSIAANMLLYGAIGAIISTIRRTSRAATPPANPHKAAL
jgi:hypothetical protein